MAIEMVPSGALQCELSEIADGMRYLARQPIMDFRGTVHGYELLFRAGREEAFRGDGDLATRTMLDNTVMFGLEKLTGGLLGFVNCTMESLTEDMVHVLPARTTVLEILESLEPTPRLIDACGNLKAAGFKLALDDFTWNAKFEPLIEMADYIKVDFTTTSAVERKKLFARLSGLKVALIAEKVETQEEFRLARAEGFTLFQGYYFCRPVLLENRKVPSNRLSQIEILRLLHQESIDVRKLSQLVKRDAALTYRLLRLVNSPICPVRHEVKSIQSALLAMGEDNFRRILTLAITSELNDGQPAEILRMAFVRGQFCELAARFRVLDSTEQYLLGLLSLLPAMLRVPMEELTPALPLRDGISQALQGAANSDRCALAWLECHEQGDWMASDAIAAQYGLNVDQMICDYAKAVAWAEEAVSAIH